MSSAAVQPQTTPNQYTQNTSSGRDRYASSSPSARRVGRQNSGHAIVSPQPPQYPSPSSSTTMTTPRPPASHASPSEPLSTSTYQQFYPDSAVPGPPTALPVRTSSQHATTSTSTAQDTRASGSRTQQQQQQQQSGAYGVVEAGRERSADNESRQRAQKSPRDDGRGQKARHAPVHSRSVTAVGQPPIDSSLPRENSAIINHIVVDDPQSDLARERARVAEAQPSQSGVEGAPPMTDQVIPADPEKRRSRQEFKQSSSRKEVKFGDYILGQTLGEGEFGKVKMGWKKDSSVQVAIKLIRKESLQSNSNRLPKIYREIAILRELRHPNIVRLHEFVETERHMGIILEYASGGELFDYILNHRYLKDPAARRLFAQLVSGVGYLHKKGIVHRDLKLENLLLDRNRNIIITDFGFANTFNPTDELGEEVEKKIGDKEYVKKEGLDRLNDKNMRRGDLMQTSCGSPCYAAPELVVSDGLYTGRKVDVWSCGVILYAMLAGYLPFDDDPANPEGDNINLLYKYIVSTPLTFPEYVTPHARDLLRRILIPDPRKRADLFEVARHSWLSEYSHVVGFIGSSSKSDRDIAVSAMQQGEEPLVARSSSVREAATRAPAAMSAGGAVKQPADVSDTEDARNKQRDAKRRTVQVEYVPPKNATTRGETSPIAAQPPAALGGGGRTRARGDGQGPVEVTQSPLRGAHAQAMPPPSRPGREQNRATSDSPAAANAPIVSHSRPNTSGTLGSTTRLPSRGNSYSQPSVATSTPMTAQGRFSQPKSSSGYIIGPVGSDHAAGAERPGSHQNLAQFRQQPSSQEQSVPTSRTHKRSSTLSSIGDRILGRSSSRRREAAQEASSGSNEKPSRKYPPVSMRNAMPSGYDDSQPRQSTESGRRPSFTFTRKNSDAPTSDSRRNSRRFSFLPPGFRKESTPDSADGSSSRRPESKSGPGQQFGLPFGRGSSRSPSRSTTNSTNPRHYEADREAARAKRWSGMRTQQTSTSGYNGSNSKTLAQQQPYSNVPGGSRSQQPQQQVRDDGYGYDANENAYYGNRSLPDGQAGSALDVDGYPHDGNDAFDSTGPSIRPNQRKFAQEYDRGYAGSSSATRRVMDFFRRRGRERSDT